MKLKVFSLALLLTAFGMAGCDNCGNGEIDVEEGEECDDGNIDDGDGCSALCTLENNNSGTPGTTTTTPTTPTTPTQTTPVCGNGQQESGEGCDDGNTTSGDGCSSTCQIESSSTPTAVCGNGNKESGEECDDGNKTDGDGCSAKCKKESSKPADECPKAGESCTESVCCGGNAYNCDNGVYEVYTCGSKTCDLFGNEADCVTSCSAQDAEYEIYEIQDDCEGSDVLYSVCEKSNAGNYGIREDYIADSICDETDSGDPVVVTCVGGQLYETDCENECVTAGSSKMKDYCK